MQHKIVFGTCGCVLSQATSVKKPGDDISTPSPATLKRTLLSEHPSYNRDFHVFFSFVLHVKI